MFFKSRKKYFFISLSVALLLMLIGVVFFEGEQAFQANDLRAGLNDSKNLKAEQFIQRKSKLEPVQDKIFIADEKIEVKDKSKPLEQIEILIDPRNVGADEDLENGASFAKTYKLLTEVRLPLGEKKSFKIKMEKPLNEVFSIVLVGGEGDGEAQIQKPSINSESAQESLEDTYFENDWKKIDMHGNTFNEMTFIGKSLTEKTSIKVYIQNYKDEE